MGFRRGGDRKGGGAGVAILIAIALIVVAWVLSLVIRFALSRSRELLADAGSVELTKNPDAMISALRKIEGRGELAGATSAVMEMCVDNPREEFSDLFATHPPIEQRIQAIMKFAGGHDPGPLALPDEAGPAHDSPPGGDPQVVPAGPWSDPAGQATTGAGAPFLKPFPPGRAPDPTDAGGCAADEPGPWGPHNRN
jgi:heat shock protein HtpX